MSYMHCTVIMIIVSCSSDMYGFCLSFLMGLKSSSFNVDMAIGWVLGLSLSLRPHDV